MWIPSKEFLTKLGFRYTYGWSIKWEGNTSLTVSWEEENPEQLGLFLWENHRCLFNGFPESEEEFLTLLRQVRWEVSP